MTYPTTNIATGDLVTASQLNRMHTAVAQATDAGASYTFSSIPQVWTHLMIVCHLQTASGSQIDDLWVRFNGDTSAKYISQYLRAIDTTVSGDGTSADTKILAGAVPGSSSGGFSTNVLFVANYTAAKYHSLVAVAHGAYDNAGATHQRIGVAGGAWFPTSPAAITQIQLLPSADAFVDGSMATLSVGGLI